MKKNLIEVREENEGAFTLIELLVVILIIGILAAIAIPVFLNQRKAAVDAAVKSDVRNAATQAETWAIANPNADIGATAITDAKVSQGTTLTLTPNTDKRNYTITGKNANGTATGAVAGIVYNSETGGLNK